jgi:hypothetical protein
MGRVWSILFFLVPILAIVTFLMAMYGVTPLETAWLPKSFSDAGDTIDQLFNGIHLLSAVILLGTGLAIGYALGNSIIGGMTKPPIFITTQNLK